MIFLRALAGIALACLILALPLARAAESGGEASPFIYAPSALAPGPSRGWVVLLPGEDELGYKAIAAHYEKVALLLNANGFDTLIVPYEEAYDEDVDGDLDSDGEKIAAVTARAVRWMHQTHPDSDAEAGAIIAWAQGALGLAVLAAPGSSYPLPNLVASIAFYPELDDEAPFNSRLPMLVQLGTEDENVTALRRYLRVQEPGSVEPVIEFLEAAKRGFDVERFAKPTTVRSVPMIGGGVTFEYNRTAAHAAQQRMLAYLKSRLEAPE